jgi:hypothetical protein
MVMTAVILSFSVLLKAQDVAAIAAGRVGKSSSRTTGSVARPSSEFFSIGRWQTENVMQLFKHSG